MNLNLLTTTQASIALVLKSDKDLDICGSYRLLSLLNAEYWQNRAEIAAQDYFQRSRDVTYFFNIIYPYAHLEKVPEIVISMDTEKVFDMVQWEYFFFFCCIQKMALVINVLAG